MITGTIRDLIVFALGAIAGVIAMYFIAKNNAKLVAGWYGELAAAGKIVGGIVGTVSKKV